MCKEYTFEEVHRNAEKTLRQTDKVIRQTEVAEESDMALKCLGRRLWPQSSSRAHTHMPSYLTLEFSFPTS